MKENPKYIQGFIQHTIISLAWNFVCIVQVTVGGRSQRISWGEAGTDPGFQAKGLEISEKKKNSNTLPYSINKLSTKTNTQKSLFFNILRYNHLPTEVKDTKHYCFLIQSSMKRELDALSNFQNHLWLNPN